MTRDRDAYADLGGGLTDPNTRPNCSWNCDGMGYDRYATGNVRVICPSHRPNLPHRNIRRSKASTYTGIRW